jgi:hypothetical protein
MSTTNQLHRHYIVIRYMAAVYGRVDVALRGSPASDNGRKVIAVDAEAPEPGEPLSAEARAAIIEATLALVQQSGMRCCAVFGPSDAVYCEADGSARSATDPPSGGVRYDRVSKSVTAPDAVEEGP